MSELHTEITTEDKMAVLRKQLVREFASMGGKARYAKMTAEERKAYMKSLQDKRAPDWKENLSRKAKARWAKVRELEAVQEEAKKFGGDTSPTATS
jgi:hypothetical protein